MSRHTRQRLLDVQAALDAITAHISRGDLSDGLVFDTTHSIVAATVTRDLPELRGAVQRLLEKPED